MSPAQCASSCSRAPAARWGAAPPSRCTRSRWRPTARRISSTSRPRSASSSSGACRCGPRRGCSSRVGRATRCSAWPLPTSPRLSHTSERDAGQAVGRPLREADRPASGGVLHLAAGGSAAAARRPGRKHRPLPHARPPGHHPTRRRPGDPGRAGRIGGAGRPARGGPGQPLGGRHSLVEGLLRERIGEPAGWLHTARSRNDQVALDERLYTRRALADGASAILDLQAALLALARRHQDVILPGYTHLQRAQPVLLAHHLLAYVEMLSRDLGRLRDAYVRADVMPLGSGALAGAPYPLDRAYVAQLLGFSAISANSLDAVSDRDFLVEHLAALSLVAVHLSRLAEELVLWSSAEFGFVEIDDSYATGSSIMPQKKNPDVAELVRGKTGRVLGALVALLTVLKGLPLAYNRDLQEDKQGYFD